ncbi:MFS transporter [Streptomyces sp. SID10853]|nr:MFS transporter [Streptomyces sp. SID10853]
MRSSRFGVPAVSAGNRPLLVAIVIDTAGAGLFLPLSLLFFAAYQHVPTAVAGSGITIGSLLSFLFIPTCGRLVQRVGPQSCLVISNALTALGYGFYFLGTNLITIGFAAFMVMLGDRLYGAAWPTTVARVATDDELARWFSFVNFLKTTCLGIGSIASTTLLALAGIKGLGVALGLNVVSSMVSAGFVLRARIPKTPRPSQTEQRSTPGRALRDRRFMSLVVSQTLLSAAWLIPTVALPLLLVEGLHQSPFWPTVVVAVRYGVIALLQVPLAERISSWSRSRILLNAIALAGIAIATTATISSAPHSAQGGVAVLVGALLATAELVSKPTASVAAVRLAPRGDEGPYMAVFQLTGTVAYAVGPAVIGFGMGNPSLLWLGLGCCVAASAAAHVLGRPHRPQRNPATPTTERSTS